ncbi:hypothetical protein OKW35_005227 [Paraburkholderia sp. MM5477-R1]
MRAPPERKLKMQFINAAHPFHLVSLIGCGRQ